MKSFEFFDKPKSLIYKDASLCIWLDLILLERHDLVNALADMEHGTFKGNELIFKSTYDIVLDRSIIKFSDHYGYKAKLSDVMVIFQKEI
jgi:hypothetical protein